MTKEKRGNPAFLPNSGVLRLTFPPQSRIIDAEKIGILAEVRRNNAMIMDCAKYAGRCVCGREHTLETKKVVV